MTAYKDRPGYGLYETLVRDRATGRVRVECRWMRDRQALNLNATPVTAPTWDSTGWLPDGRHRKTGTPLNPDGVPVEYDQDARGGDASLMTDAALARVHRAHVPAPYARATALALPEWRRGEAADTAIDLHKAGVGEEHLPMLAQYPAAQVKALAENGIAPEYAPLVAEPERREEWTVKEVPVIRDGRIYMENRRVIHTDRDAAHRTQGDLRRDSGWRRSKPRAVTAADLAQPDDENSVRLPYGWQEMRSAVKRMGGKWQPMSKTWRLPDADKAAEIRRVLEERAVREGVI